MARESMKKKRGEKIDHIIAVATEVFSEKGYHGALTDDIADRAGISKRSMYYYIGDKDMLYEAVWDRLSDKLSLLLDTDLEKSESPKIKLINIIHRIGEIGKFRPVHSIALRELLSGGKNLPKKLLKDADHIIERFVSICEELKAENADIDVSPVVVAWMIFGFFVYWDITMPHLYECEGGTQREAIGTIGTDVNEKLIKEVEKLVFRMLNVKSDM